MKAVALVDSVRWMEGEGDDRHVVTFDGEAGSAKGMEFELPSSEFDRLEAAGAVAKPRSKAARAAADAADAAPPVSPPPEEPSPETVQAAEEDAADDSST